MDCRAQISLVLGTPFRGQVICGGNILDSWQKTTGDNWGIYNSVLPPKYPMSFDDDFVLSSISEIDPLFWEECDFAILTPNGVWDRRVFYPANETVEETLELKEYALVPRNLASLNKHWPELVSSHLTERMKHHEDFIYELDPNKDVPVVANCTMSERENILDLADKMRDNWLWSIEDGQCVPVSLSGIGARGLKPWFPDIGNVSFFILPPSNKNLPGIHSDILALDSDSGDVVGFVSKEFRFVYEQYRGKGIGQALIIADELTGAKAMNATSFTEAGLNSRLKALKVLADITLAMERPQGKKIADGVRP